MVLVVLIKFMWMRQPAGVVEGPGAPAQSAKTPSVRRWMWLRNSRQRNVSAATAALGML
jgi:hypothetical protein